MTYDQLGAAIREVRARTDRPFGVNLRADAEDADARVALLIDEGVKVASFALAPREHHVKQLKDAGIAVVPSVGARRHAEKVAAWGADAVIVQGGEGGGHTGPVPTTLLLPQIVDAVDIPVIAAGGFFDGRGLVAALAYGAAGVAMGTRFLLTQESTVPDTVKRYYLGKSVTDTVVTTRIDGLPHRVLRTDFVDELESGHAITGLPHRGAQRGRLQEDVRRVVARDAARRARDEARRQLEVEPDDPRRQHADAAAGGARRGTARRRRTVEWPGRRRDRGPAHRRRVAWRASCRKPKQRSSDWESCREGTRTRRRGLVHPRRSRAAARRARAARNPAATSGRPGSRHRATRARPARNASPRCCSRRGRLWSWTTNHYAPPEPYVAPDPFVPYTVCAVELDAEQMVVLGQLATGADADVLEIGMPMELVLGPLYEDDDHEYVVWQWAPAATGDAR